MSRRTRAGRNGQLVPGGVFGAFRLGIDGIGLTPDEKPVKGILDVGLRIVGAPDMLAVRFVLREQGLGRLAAIEHIALKIGVLGGERPCGPFRRIGSVQFRFSAGVSP